MCFKSCVNIDKDGILTNTQFTPKNFYFFDDVHQMVNNPKASHNNVDDSVFGKTDYFPTKVSNREDVFLVWCEWGLEIMTKLSIDQKYHLVSVSFDSIYTVGIEGRFECFRRF